ANFMDAREIIRQSQEMRHRIQAYSGPSEQGVSLAHGAKAQVCEFLRAYAGPNSEFLAQAEAVSGADKNQLGVLSALLDSFVEYVKAGLFLGLSPERQAQIDVVSDILGQADSLLENKECHPAAAAVLIGAALEEFLRNWVEDEELSIGSSSPGI